MAKMFGKETKANEMKEAKAVKSGKMTPKQYAKGEASEGKGEGKGALAMGKKLKSGKVSPFDYASKMKCGGKVKKMAAGGKVEEPTKAEADRMRAQQSEKKMQEKMDKAYDNSTTRREMSKKFAKGGGVERKGKTRGKII